MTTTVGIGCDELKLASEHFGGKNCEINRAAIVQAVAIFFRISDWNGLARGHKSN